MVAEGEALAGGMVNAGAVFRRGDVVERPAPHHAPALHTPCSPCGSTASTPRRSRSAPSRAAANG